MRQQSSVARLLASAAMAATLAVGLGGCQTMSDITGSVTSKAEASPDADKGSSSHAVVTDGATDAAAVGRRAAEPAT